MAGMALRVGALQRALDIAAADEGTPVLVTKALLKALEMLQPQCLWTCLPVEIVSSPASEGALPAAAGPPPAGHERAPEPTDGSGPNPGGGGSRSSGSQNSDSGDSGDSGGALDSESSTILSIISGLAGEADVTDALAAVCSQELDIRSPKPPAVKAKAKAKKKKTAVPKTRKVAPKLNAPMPAWGAGAGVRPPTTAAAPAPAGGKKPPARRTPRRRASGAAAGYMQPIRHLSPRSDAVSLPPPPPHSHHPPTHTQAHTDTQTHTHTLPSTALQP